MSSSSTFEHWGELGELLLPGSMQDVVFEDNCANRSGLSLSMSGVGTPSFSRTEVGTRQNSGDEDNVAALLEGVNKCNELEELHEQKRALASKMSEVEDEAASVARDIKRVLRPRRNKPVYVEVDDTIYEDDEISDYEREEVRKRKNITKSGTVKRTAARKRKVLLRNSRDNMNYKTFLSRSKRASMISELKDAFPRDELLTVDEIFKHPCTEHVFRPGGDWIRFLNIVPIEKISSCSKSKFSKLSGQFASQKDLMSFGYDFFQKLLHMVAAGVAPLACPGRLNEFGGCDECSDTLGIHKLKRIVKPRGVVTKNRCSLTAYMRSANKCDFSQAAKSRPGGKGTRKTRKRKRQSYTNPVRQQSASSSTLRPLQPPSNINDLMGSYSAFGSIGVDLKTAIDSSFNNLHGGHVHTELL